MYILSTPLNVQLASDPLPPSGIVPCARIFERLRFQQFSGSAGALLPPGPSGVISHLQQGPACHAGLGAIGAHLPLEESRTTILPPPVRLRQSRLRWGSREPGDRWPALRRRSTFEEDSRRWPG